MEKIKRCSDCGRFLGESAFGWADRKKGYKCSACKKCRVNQARLWSTSNKERVYENQKSWGEINKDKLKKQKKQWELENIEHIKQQRRQYYKNNKELILKRNKKYSQMWRPNNQHKLNAKEARRRAVKRNQTPQLTKEEKQQIEVLYRWAQELPGEWHVDHVIPLNEGGLHHPDNLQLIPAKQNLEKNDKHPEEFYGRFNEFLIN